MLLFLLAYLAGILTILSPCILPVLPFIFSRADQPFMKAGLPMLLSMALSFSLIAFLSAVGGTWVVQANHYGRIAAMVLLLFFAATLISKRLAAWLTRPFVALGNRLLGSQQSGSTTAQPHGWGSSLLVGVATGLLWAPCAGPILGIILTGAAINGATAQTAGLLVAYAAGAITSIAVALFAGKRIFTTLKQSLGAGEWVRRGLGGAIIVGVLAIASGLDTGLLTRLSSTNTNVLEEKLLRWFQPQSISVGLSKTGAEASNQDLFYALNTATAWINTPPLTPEHLKGKVVLVDFWTYSCINCLRSLPYVRAWAEKYKKEGLVVLGVHTPEFAFEKDLQNVQRAVRDLGLSYPVALDNTYGIWQSFNNRYWPAHYFIDRKGVLRHQHFGEGEYEQSERMIQKLLAEDSQAAQQTLPTDLVKNEGKGAQAAADLHNIKSHETYLGYQRAENFISGDIAQDSSKTYRTPTRLKLNQWGLKGPWTITPEKAILTKQPGSIIYRFHARDVHLVMGPGADGKPVRFKVRIDNRAPGNGHGMDINAEGVGVVTEQRLYQLVRQIISVEDLTFEIEFLDPGVEVFAFTFG